MNMEYLELKYRQDKKSYKTIKGNPEKVLSSFLEIMINKHNIDIEINGGIKIKEKSLRELLSNMLTKKILEIKIEDRYLIIRKL